MIDSKNYYIETSKIYEDVINNSFKMKIIDVQGIGTYTNENISKKKKLEIQINELYEKEVEHHELIISNNFENDYNYISDYLFKKYNQKNTTIHCFTYCDIGWGIVDVFKYNKNQKFEENTIKFHDLYIQFIENKKNEIIEKGTDNILKEYMNKLLKEDSNDGKETIFAFLGNSFFEFLFQSISNTWMCSTFSNEKEILSLFGTFGFPGKMIIHQQNFKYSTSMSSFFNEHGNLNLQDLSDGNDGIFNNIRELYKFNKFEIIHNLENEKFVGYLQINFSKEKNIFIY